MQIEVVKEFEFCAAHHLPNHPKCGQVHGHNYRVLVGFKAPVDMIDSEKGMLLDFGKIKEYMEPIIDSLDHINLNDDTLRTPTAENIAMYIFDKLYKAMIGWTIFANQLDSITVYETPCSYAKVSKNG